MASAELILNAVLCCKSINTLCSDVFAAALHRCPLRLGRLVPVATQGLIAANECGIH